MNIASPLTLLLALAIGSFSPIGVACPELPTDSGLEWNSSRGPDFDVCRAVILGSEEVAFGIYFGNNPSFRKRWSAKIGKGTVGGRRVVWYRQDPEANSAKFAQESVVGLGKKGYVAHVWVGAETESELNSYLSVLKRIQFSQR